MSLLNRPEGECRQLPTSSVLLLLPRPLRVSSSINLLLQARSPSAGDCRKEREKKMIKSCPDPQFTLGGGGLRRIHFGDSGSDSTRDGGMDGMDSCAFLL